MLRVIDEALTHVVVGRAWAAFVLELRIAQEAHRGAALQRHIAINRFENLRPLPLDHRIETIDAPETGKQEVLDLGECYGHVSSLLYELRAVRERRSQLLRRTTTMFAGVVL